MNRKPTHKVSFWGVRCYWHDPTSMMWGVNWFWDWMVEPVVCIHNLLSELTGFLFPGWESPGFPLVILEEYDRAD